MSVAGSSVTGAVKSMVYSVEAHSQAVAGSSVTVAPVQVCAAAGIATALKAITRPTVTRILIIFLTSFLLSYDQAFPDFEAVWLSIVVTTICR
jgi:hypothetical protein